MATTDPHPGPPGPGLDRIPRLAAALLGAPSATLRLLPDDGRGPLATHGPPRDEAGLFERVVSARGTWSTGGVGDRGDGSYLGTPLLGDGGAILGVLGVRADGARAWSVDDERSLTDLAACAAAMVAGRPPGHRAGEARGLNADLERRVESRTAELENARREAEAASRAKAAFLANMSHEVRTPMAAVLGYADMLLDPALRPVDRDHALQAIRRNGADLMRLIDNILDLSKIEAGRMELDVIAYGPWRVALEVASILRIRADEQSVRVEVVAEGPLPDRGLMDPTRVRQVLMNLVSNAIKFAEPGGRVVVRVSAGPGAGATPVDGPLPLRFEVEDTGIGMTPAQLAQVFAPFQQADATTTRRFGGSGLGLSICPRLVDAMGGRIWARSEPGLGSTFAFEVPLPMPAGGAAWLGPEELVPAAIDAPPADGPRAARSFRGRVLVVEDSPEIALILAHALTRMGLEVESAPNGLVGVDLAMSGRFDLILMDMQMPELDGLGAASSIRRAGLRVPIVALTAHAMVEDRDRSLRAGCDDYLTKPVATELLASTLARYLRPGPATPDTGPAPAAREAAGDREADAPPDLVRDFAALLPAKVARLRSCLASRDLAGLSMLAAHRLRGSAGMYGFPGLTETAGLIEDAAREGQEELIGGLVEELAEEVTRIAPDEGRPPGAPRREPARSRRAPGPRPAFPPGR